MSPDPTTNRRQAIIWGATTLLFAILELLIIHNISTGQPYTWFTRNDPDVYAFFLGLFIALFAAIVGMMLMHERNLRQALSGDTRTASRAAIQPDPASALQSDETLALTRTLRPASYAWRLAATLCLVFLSFAGLAPLGEISVYLAMPHAVDWLLAFLAGPRSSWLPSHPPALSLIEWLAFLAPFALAAICSASLVIEAVSMRRQDISVDDLGVTVQRPLRRPQFIPWDDIHLILRFGANEAPGNAYWLRGHRHGVALALGARGPFPSQKGHPRASAYQFDAAPDDYPTAVQRLLATLTERARVPIRVWAGGYLTRQPRSAPSAGGLTLDDALTLPLAEDTLQPNPTDVEVARASATSATITLRPSVTLRALAPEFAKNAAIIGGGFVVLILITLVPGASTVNEVIAPLLSPAGLRTIGSGACVTFVLSVFATMTRYRNFTAPIVFASSAGLTLKYVMGASSRIIPWRDIRAWAILPSAPGASAPMNYVVWSGAQTLEWAEPPNAQLVGRGVQGDRREAYRATARQLHALIAARTGLPLRVIQPRPSA